VFEQRSDEVHVRQRGLRGVAPEDMLVTNVVEAVADLVVAGPGVGAHFALSDT
jgi:hypothetical protein